VVPVESGKESRVSMGLSFFIEDSGGRTFIGHSGSQNAFVTHFFVHPPTRTGYLVAYNTLAEPPAGGKAPSTGQLDRTIKERLFKDVFPLFEAH
jgi:hypothetical protein